jgi:nicotinate-nucleotide pyrophosphorylase (carboxylating)
MHLDKPARDFIKLALNEDIGERDVTTFYSVRPGTKGDAVIISRNEGIVCGIDILRETMLIVNSQLVFKVFKKDGSRVKKDDVVLSVTGDLADILTAERVAVNFLSILSGVATTTRQFVDKVEGTGVTILDTRKTTPGMRLMEKYAVMTGGATNHRKGLYDGIIIKDNHLRAAAILVDGKIDSNRIKEVMLGLREATGFKVEIEVETVEEFKKVAVDKPEIVMLDNFSLKAIKQAVKYRNAHCRQIKLEVSGGVNLKNVRKIALACVDFISIGSITHSPKSFDFSLEITKVYT